MDIKKHLTQAINGLVPSDTPPSKRADMKILYMRCMYNKVIPIAEEVMESAENDYREAGISPFSKRGYIDIVNWIKEMQANAMKCPCPLAESDNPELCEASHTIDYALGKALRNYPPGGQ